MDSKILSALISAGTSIGTVLIFKPLIEKHLLKFNLKYNYIFEQSKKVQDHIAKHKVQLLRSAELLNNRMKNFAKNYHKGWLDVNGKYQEDNHYIDTTVYRFLAFYAQIQLIENDLIYIDSTISQKKDIRMLKYFRLFYDVMCDVEIFNGFEYDINIAKDHFFTTPFYYFSNNLIENGKVINLDTFLANKNELLSKIQDVYIFFDSMTPNENRLRCERLKIFHIILIAFLNEYGYDYQKTSSKTLKLLKKELGDYILIKNLKPLIKKYKLKKVFRGQIETIISKLS